MKRPLLLQLALALAISPAALPLQAADERPNILTIVVDDMGYSDPSALGSEIATPNIDSTAETGVRVGVGGGRGRNGERVTYD